MKLLLIHTVICFLLVFNGTEPSIAQDIKPFAEMSLEELQKIDKKLLSKEDKKLHKKALKAAKKAAKARIKAEKKEKKRKEKERKKYLKVAQNLINSYTFLRNDTKVYRDEFSPEITILGTQLYIEGNGRAGYSKTPYFNDYYRLRGTYNKETEELSLQIYFKNAFKKHFYPDPETKTNFSASANAEYYAYWDNYTAARLRGGQELTIHQGKQTIECDDYSYTCYYEEAIFADLPEETLLSASTKDEALHIKFYSRNSSPIIIKLPRDYVMAFYEKLAKINKQKYARHGQIALEYINELEEIKAALMK